MILSDNEALILQLCNKHTVTTMMIASKFAEMGKKPSYNYINKTLNELVDRGYVWKRKLIAKGKKGKMVWYTTKESGIRAAINYYETKEVVEKNKVSKSKLMMNDNTLVKYC